MTDIVVPLYLIFKMHTQRLSMETTNNCKCVVFAHVHMLTLTSTLHVFHKNSVTQFDQVCISWAPSIRCAVCRWGLQGYGLSFLNLEHLWRDFHGFYWDFWGQHITIQTFSAQSVFLCRLPQELIPRPHPRNLLQAKLYLRVYLLGTQTATILNIAFLWSLWNLIPI